MLRHSMTATRAATFTRRNSSYFLVLALGRTTVHGRSRFHFMPECLTLCAGGRTAHCGEALTMGDYFKPWRRKFGLLTLVTACVFAVAWVRSISVVDSVRCRLIPAVSLRLHSGEIYCFLTSNPRISQTDPMVSCSSDKASSWGKLEFEGQWGSLGFGFIQQPGRMTVGMPYWSIVVPLTLISAWLLLSMPGKMPPKKIAEPTAIEVR